MLEPADGADQAEDREQRGDDEEAIDRQAVEVAPAQQRRRAEDAGGDAGVRDLGAGNGGPFKIHGFEARVHGDAVHRHEVEAAVLEGLRHQRLAGAYTRDPAALRCLGEDADGVIVGDLGPHAGRGFSFRHRIERNAAANSFERSAGDEQAFHLGAGGDEFCANVTCQRFGFPLLLVEDRVVRKLPFFESLEGEGAAEGKHQDGEHADGNRTTRLFQRRLWRSPSPGRPRPQYDSFRSRTDSPVLDSKSCERVNEGLIVGHSPRQGKAA
ncbi:MAG: hypothetical protein QM773_17130 [Hyphomonadaceae bacterium]